MQNLLTLRPMHETGSPISNVPIYMHKYHLYNCVYIYTHTCIHLNVHTLIDIDISTCFCMSSISSSSNSVIGPVMKDDFSGQAKAGWKTLEVRFSELRGIKSSEVHQRLSSYGFDIICLSFPTHMF